MTKDELSKNLEVVIGKISNVCDKCGRNVSDIFICCASKMQSVETIELLNELNIVPYIGENKVQEFVDKYKIFTNLRWHFIGQLQSNKVKYIVGKVELIHSVDKLSLLEKINTVAEKKEVVQDILLEVNIADEESKGGASLAELFELAERAVKMKNIRLRGIMTIMPIADESILRGYFKLVKETYEKIKMLYPKEKIDYLSAGMSGDFELALEYGANLIRIGTAIFGQRNYFAEGNCAEKKEPNGCS